MRCPRCLHVVPPDAVTCDCGFHLRSGGAHAEHLKAMRNARQQMFAGGALALAGTAVTVLSFFWPVFGDWYLWGAAIAGGATMFARAQGNFERLREDDAQRSQSRA